VVLIPDTYSDIKAKIIAIGALAATVGGIARQLIAWLDTGNTSFGRVKVEIDPGVDNPGDDDDPDGALPAEGLEPIEANEPDLTEAEAAVEPPADIEEQG
jgi:hypothetical protein